MPDGVQAGQPDAIFEHVPASWYKDTEARLPSRFHSPAPLTAVHIAPRNMYIRLENSNNKNLVGAKDMFLTVEIPNLLPDALQSTPEEFARQAKMAMAVKLYEMGKISSGIAAGMLNMERVHFLLQLGEYGVPMIDLSLEELESDIRNA